MTAVVVAGLTGIHLTVLAVLTVSILACIVVATRRRPAPNPALKAAVDKHWDHTGKHPRWDGSTFVRPTAADAEPEGESK